MDTLTYAHSDLGNAQLFSELHSSHLRYRPDTQEWLHWNGSHSWTRLDRDEELRFAAYTAKYRFNNIAELDLEAQKRESSWALQSQSMPRMQAMIAYARSQPPIKSTEAIWDANPSLLAVANGVVDLTTGQLRDGKPGDYLTQHTPIAYDPSSTCPRFLQFLHEIFDGDQDRIQYIQRAVGYSLTGHTREQVFFLLHGTGSNGKSRFRNIITRLLGPYSSTIRFSAFEESPMSDSQRDLAEISSTRAVFASEGTEKRKLDTSVLKYITGEEPIRTARKYGHPFSFQPQFKIWLSSNYLPKVQDDSKGFWRRVVLIPFDIAFEGNRKDPDLESKLNAELPGILNWAIEGAIQWHSRGLQTPDSLLIQVSKYRDSQDILSKFLSEETYTNVDGFITASDFYEAYILWCHDNGESPMTATAFGRLLSKQYTKKRNSLGNYYEGISLLHPVHE